MRSCNNRHDSVFIQFYIIFFFGFPFECDAYRWEIRLHEITPLVCPSRSHHWESIVHTTHNNHKQCEPQSETEMDKRKFENIFFWQFVTVSADATALSRCIFFVFSEAETLTTKRSKFSMCWTCYDVWSQITINSFCLSLSHDWYGKGTTTTKCDYHFTILFGRFSLLISSHLRSWFIHFSSQIQVLLSIKKTETETNSHTKRKNIK